MDAITRFLLDFFLFKNFAKAVRTRAEQFLAWLTSIKPFSWEATLLLSLFSWFVHLLVQGELAKDIVSFFAWGFLIIAVDWALLGKQFTIPLIGFPFQHGPWISGAITCVALLSNDLIIQDVRGALISWPIFSAGFAGYSKFIQPGLRWQLPDANGRQDLVLLFLISGLFSSWFQFHFLIQDILAQYPNLLADDFGRSSFVMRVNPISRPTTKAYALLDTAEAVVREDLAGKNWIEVQRWLRNVDQVEASLSQRTIDRAYRDQVLPREKQLWQITADTAFNSTNIELTLRAQWQGASSRPGGYTLRRTCFVTEAIMPTPETFEDFQRSASYRLSCQPTREE